MSRNRTPPHNVEAEMSVLGGILLAPAMLDVAADLLTPADFYADAHARIFAAMLVLQERREPVDSVVLLDVLRERDELERVGGASYLGTLADDVPTSSHVATYARLVRNTATQRRMLEAGQAIAEAGYEHHSDVAEYVSASEARVLAVGLPASEAIVSTALESTMAARERLHARDVRRIPTGYPDVDEKLGGFLRGTLVVIGARPGTGKSIVVSDFALEGAIPAGVGVLHRSLEMNREELMLRAVAKRARIPNWRLQRGYVDDHDREKADVAFAELADLPWLIRDQPAPWTQDIRAYERVLRQHPTVGMLIIDHIKLIRGVEGGSIERRHLVIGEITSALCDLARRRNIVVIVVSQLNRETEKQNREPFLADLRESGSLEQDASMVIFLHAPERDAPGDQPMPLEFIVAKNRQGPIGRFHFTCVKQFCDVSDRLPETRWGAEASS